MVRSKRRSSPRCCREPRCALPPIENISPKQIAEDVADVHAARKRASAKTLPAQPRMAVAIVGRALVRVAQHLVGLAGLLELLLGRMVARDCGQDGT